MSGLYGNAVMAPAALKTVIIEDADGNELTGVVTGEQVIFDATPNDVRLGKTFAGDEGVKVGQKDIPSYHTTTGVQYVPANTEFKITISIKDRYDYTELQAMIIPWNTNYEDSVAVEKVVIENNVYNAGSTTAIATITKDAENKSILFGITNGDTPAIIRFFTYKEES
jgi:hypothetical protein